MSIKPVSSSTVPAPVAPRAAQPPTPVSSTAPSAPTRFEPASAAPVALEAAAVATSDGTVTLGSRGPAVTRLKTLLRDAGFYDGVINDEMGSMGVEALRRAKQALRLTGPVDVAGPTTVAALERTVRRAGASQDFGAQLRSNELSKTPIYLAIGLAEGTIGADGRPTSAYFGHGDPGNGALNRGFGSYQVRQHPRGASLTAAEADRVQADRLEAQWPAIDQALTRAGIQPGPTRNLIAANALDGWNQAPATFGGRNGLLNPERLAELQRSIASGKSPIEAIVDWRANSYREDNGVLNAPGLGNSLSRVREDQRRRAEAVAQGLSLRGGSTTTTPATGTPSAGAPTASATPIATRQLHSGVTGDDVQSLQRALNQAGASPRLEEDGDFGPKTETAVRRFQQTFGLDVDGIAGPETLAKLQSAVSPTARSPEQPTTTGQSIPFDVRPGSRGPQVRELKQALAAAGFYDGVINDEMGPMGVEALKKAKAALRLGGPPDVAGPTTMEALRRAAASPVAGSPNAISEQGQAQMRRLIEHARANHQGASLGDCFKFVWGYMTKSGYGKLDDWNDLPRMNGDLARGLPDYLNASPRHLEEAGLQRLDTATQPPITNPHDPRIPPGAVIVVAPGSTGTAHPTAGDIVVKGSQPGEFINDGPRMNYGTRDSWQGRILGVYVPR
ncbi:MAG: peptidoglycan-binding protein [Myxococcaceae bacterium]|jgi:peptidoglycan hydrolase-like protein with peptidoglycan-binding domain|nr:peptidoglycan-binding protein [Myxococcaceae bacterium]